jgi:hypothetical protein
MEKNRLPYYIKIDKNKDGIPVIHVRRFRFIFLLNAILVAVVLGALIYLVNFMNLQAVAMVILGGMIALAILMLPITIGLLVYLFQFFVNINYIHLEPDEILKRVHPLTWQNSLKIPVSRILSVISAPTYNNENKPTKSLVVNLDSGGMISLADNLTDPEVSNYLSEFIRNYYGLDEKPKNQSNEK